MPRPNVGVLRDKQAFEGPRTTCGSEFPLADGLVRYPLIRVGGDCEESVSPVLFRCKFSDAHERLTGPYSKVGWRGGIGQCLDLATGFHQLY